MRSEQSNIENVFKEFMDLPGKIYGMLFKLNITHTKETDVIIPHIKVISKKPYNELHLDFVSQYYNEKSTVSERKNIIYDAINDLMEKFFKNDLKQYRTIFYNHLEYHCIIFNYAEKINDKLGENLYLEMDIVELYNLLNKKIYGAKE